MTNCDKITERMTANATPEIMGKVISPAWLAISNRIPGWSSNLHYLFFKSVLEACPEVKSILMLGVYLGRDIAMICDAAPNRPLQIVGVDKFKDEPCLDWAVDLKTKSWTEAGFGPPPDAKKAYENINAQPPHAVRLIETDSETFLSNVRGKFDLAYVDTSHEEGTVRRELELIRPLCHEGTTICGDDYVNEGKAWWGVDKAVKKTFKNHQVALNMIWYAGAEDYL